jgi:NAD(P)H-hydrate repair Nnr-like enzyme with NAD(P)H-hydrate dehydratase domain
MSETTEPSKSRISHNDTPDRKSPDPGTEKGVSGRRTFLAGVAGVVGATGISALASGDSKEVKNKILSRIQEQIDRDHVEDPMNYDRSVVTHGKYVGS